MKALATRRQRRKRSQAVHVGTLSTNRIVYEISAEGDPHPVTVDIAPSSPESGAITIDTLAAVIELMEIGPNQGLTVVPVQISTGVLTDAVEYTSFIWRDLDQALRYVRSTDERRVIEQARGEPYGS